MVHNITGLFDSRAEADLVVEHLVQQIGISRAKIQVHAAEAGAVSDAYSTAKEEGGFWAALKDIFMSDEDRPAYAEGVRRGGVVVSAQVDEGQSERAMDVFEQYGAVDLDSREKEWRQSGWEGSHESAPMATPASGMGTTASPLAAPASPVAAPASPMAASDASVSGREEQAIPIIQESLRVGKRQVEGGRVRVRSYVVETPVTEEVTLRHEHVDVQRRPVDRALTSAEEAFQERSIVATEHSEEVVIAKEARVTEELVIHKDVGERVETVHETVRRQDVEIEDTRHSGMTGTAGSASGSVQGENPPGTMATRAMDDTLDTNLSGTNPKI
ncbi:MAG: hypothetical protein JWR10_4132 [Rubritepida sp.]|nr:hypothetical protein [Rubritepida sp.]